MSNARFPRWLTSRVYMFVVAAIGIAGGLYPYLARDSAMLLSHTTCRAIAMIAIGLLSCSAIMALAHCGVLMRSSRRRTTELESQTQILAVSDPLTDLFNRRGFEERGGDLLALSERNKGEVILLQFDVDKFKDVNDIYGHAAGDLVLKSLAEMLRASLPEEAIIGRLGGDEFAVLVTLDDLGERAEIGNFGIPSEVSVTLEEVRRRLNVRISGGYARAPQDGRTLTDLLQAADLALLSVKRSGRGAIRSYEAEMTQTLKRRVWEIDGIRGALRDGQVIPYYQPIICTRTGRIVSMESLARWQHGVLGVLTPERFANALRDPGLGPTITDAMLSHIVRDLGRMRKAGVPQVSITLNVGEADLRFGDLPGKIACLLDTARLPRKSIVIEVTENCLSEENRKELIPVLASFRANGTDVALDDFGTGTSSITLLKDIPCSTVKIDRSFIKDLLSSPTDMAITRSLTALCNELDLKVVAEGIETADQEEVLCELGVHQLQGYLFGKPMPFDAATAMVVRRNALETSAGVTGAIRSRVTRAFVTH